jgi:hypothetical protein
MPAVPEEGPLIMAHLCSTLQECKKTGLNSDQKMTVKITPAFLTMQLMGSEKIFHNVNHFYILNNMDSMRSSWTNWQRPLS